MALELASLETGEGTAPIVVMHGLFGSSRNWNMIARRLAPTHRVHALDLRNHGLSPWSDATDYPAMAEDVAAYIEARHLGPCPVLGHSMGGKVAMWLALSRPDLVERVIAADIAPVAYRSTLIDYIRAMRALDLSRFSRRAEVEAALEGAIPVAGERSFMMQNLVAEGGALRWRINLEALERGFGEIVGFPETPPGTRYEGPALFLDGERSGYIRPEHVPAIRGLFPRAEIVTIPEAGHWLHAERPEEVFEALARFLAS